MKTLIKRIIKRAASDKVIKNLKSLYPSHEIRERTEIYYLMKIKYSLLVLLVGAIISVLTCINTDTVIKNGRIKRGDIGEGTKSLFLYVESEENETFARGRKPIAIDVSEKRYSPEEILKLSDEFKGIFISEVIADNDSPDYVVSNMNFTRKIKGYPFDISYRTDRPLLLSRDGVINVDNLVREEYVNEGILISVIATITYFEYREEIQFYVRVYERPLSEEEGFEKSLYQSLYDEDKRSINEEYYVLPQSVNGKGVRFYEKKNKTAILIMILTAIACLLVFFSKDKELDDKTKEKTMDLIYEYPALVNKFALFLSAGMPVKNIWMKLCSRYIEEKEETGVKKYLYEEMLITKAQILNGKREIEAYNEFAKRINIQKYGVFISLLEQTVTIGKSDMANKLKKLSSDAFLERKNNAKRKFEEASTKLLVPMFMMLMVVIAIIMFPALTSFKM